MSSAKAETLHIDDAREWLVAHFADLLEGGAHQLRIRVTHPDSEHSEAWLYRHQNNQWVKTEWVVSEPALVIAVQNVAEMLGSHPPSEDWHSRRRHSADFEDIDLTFRKESLAKFRGENLESWLRGALFHDRHSVPESRRMVFRSQGRSHQGPAGNN